MEKVVGAMDSVRRTRVSPGQTVFARWSLGALPGEKAGRKREWLINGYSAGLSVVGGIVSWMYGFATFSGAAVGFVAGVIFSGILQIAKTARVSPASQPLSAEAEQLRSLYQAGLITKEEFKRRKNLLR